MSGEKKTLDVSAVMESGAGLMRTSFHKGVDSAMGAAALAVGDAGFTLAALSEEDRRAVFAELGEAIKAGFDVHLDAEMPGMTAEVQREANK
ncbi:hypothetical protein SEA_ORCANUS_50 [Arthrobacter phage Orcanus]|nr:hypothetical protein SEA_ORCANUS_50 [Arthrobacter phage Orcanus]